ncbi:MAG TPA: HlyD family efflux transporter periplasmic adaptor subunit [Aeromicrobium sp.]|nr:HlyD family efflux transporter periplasmic adaptor subunit [Aeromicrobium sp.]
MTSLSRRTVATAVGLTAITMLAACSSSAPATKTAAVERAPMATGISSTGSLSAATEQNLGFAKGGQLTAVNVKVGDKVEAGQVLASIDPVPAQQALAQQRAQLRAQEALLDKAEDSPAVGDARDSLSQAKDVLDAVRGQVEQQDEADRVAVYNAQQQLAADQNAAASAKSARDSACSGWSTPNCTSAQAAYSAAVQRVVASQSALRSVEQKRDLDRASGQVSIENAQQAVVMARNTVDSSKSDRPHAIDEQEALVAAARAAVAQAERDLANTTLRAPAAGTVTALNGAVGEYVAASTGTSALAPGTDAAIPGASGASSGGSATGAATLAAASSPARPGGTQFLVLSDIDQLQVVALFTESDAATLTQGRHVDVTLDALPDVTLGGRVASVAPSGTSVSGVISYYVTVNLDDTDRRLKAGQTATVSIPTGDTSDVLTVPSAAVHTSHGRTAVTVVEGDRKRTVTFQVGAVNGGRTEVISGLREGQRVALPTGTDQGGSDD